MNNADYNRVRMEIFNELKRKVMAFIGKRVRIWTKYTQPVEGILVFFSLVTPFLLFIVDDNGFPHAFNVIEVVEVESREKFKIP